MAKFLKPPTSNADKDAGQPGLSRVLKWECNGGRVKKKQKTVVHPYTGRLLSNKKAQTTDLDASQRHSRRERSLRRG